MTVALRLFRRTDPAAELETRVMGDGDLVVGRDKTADWVIPDPSRTLSRHHCLISVRGGAVTVRDDSTNGIHLLDGARLPGKTPTPVAAGATVVLGAFMIRIESEAPMVALAGPAPAGTLPVLADETLAGRLLDAFCRGAQIDASLLSAEDPTEVMRRLGAVYREMVQGLGALVNDRTQAKAEYGLEWTAVQALDNNPFRWAPPQRVAVDLLQARQDGFLTSEAAVRSSFEDVRDHQQRLAIAAQAAVGSLLAELSPDAIGEGLQGQSLFMKKKSEALWAEYRKAHEKACQERGGAAFREAYAEAPSASTEPGRAAASA